MTKHKDLKDEDGNSIDPFQEVLNVMTSEHLIRFRKRLKVTKRKEMVLLFDEELKRRNGQDDPKVDQAMLESARASGHKRLKGIT